VNLVRAAATVGSLTLASRILGFLRDVLIAAVLGAGAAADAFFVAFKLANMLRRLFAEGAFSAGFVPLFARTLEQEGAEPARAFASHALTLMIAVLAAVVLAAELFMPWLVRALATGFDPGSERYLLAVELSRSTFPYLMLISLAALVSGVLNGIGRFAAAAFAPILLNLALVASIGLAVATRGSAAHALAWGVLAAGFLQLGALLLVAARAGWRGSGASFCPGPSAPASTSSIS
jgi:putative peptidoglycan lipid II flippase